jgi:hypothetical protein
MREHLERDRGHQDGSLDLRAEHRGSRRDLRDVDQHPGPELPALEGLGVPAQGALVARAAGEVAVRSGLEALGRQPLEIGDVDRLGDARTLVAML